jgi:hypothetical protein
MWGEKKNTDPIELFLNILTVFEAELNGTMQA